MSGVYSSDAFKGHIVWPLVRHGISKEGCKPVHQGGYQMASGAGSDPVKEKSAARKAGGKA